ncbi:hypothetical protein ABW20_dc0105778 [Dactylellina cionopaga]|nr:hypothetical protein ABW20_dc0105778 [Dactylellina cionopaga]
MFSATRVHSNVVCEDNGNKAYQRGCEGQAGSTLDVTSPDFNQSFAMQYNFTMDPNDQLIKTQLGEYQTEGHIPIILNTAPGVLSLGDYPLEIMSLVLPNIQRKSGVGMGRWSTFLDRLYEFGHVPSRVWGFAQGSYSDADSHDGELVVGGYNPKAISGEFRNFTISDVGKDTYGRSGLHCPLQITVSGFSISVGQSTYSLMPDENFKLLACIDPFQQSISMPVSMMSRFLEITGAMIPPPNGAESPKPLVLSTSDRKIENVTITIQQDSDSFQVTIPGNETMNPSYGKLPDGKIGFLEGGNFTQLEFRNRSDNYPVDDSSLPPMIIGGIFLSQQYLLVDYSRNTFGLAQTVYRQVVSGGTDLITICDLDMNDTQSRGNEKNLTIGLAVLAAVGWLVAVVLSYLVIKFRRRKPSSASAGDTEEGPRGIFGSYDPVRVIKNRLGSYSGTLRHTIPTTIVIPKHKNQMLIVIFTGQNHHDLRQQLSLIILYREGVLGQHTSRLNYIDRKVAQAAHVH